MLPKHIRLLLLSATVGNAVEFLNWLDRCHGRKLELVESKERKVPLTYHWVPRRVPQRATGRHGQGRRRDRKTPALVFCFNRDECWSVAEQLKGLRPAAAPAQKGPLNAEVDKLEWPQGVGPKLKQMLHRGVGVHHAGLLPQVSPHRRGPVPAASCWRVVVCTETLAAGINLPARSVVLTSLVKGPPGKQKLIDASTAHQIFGRAGRPQFDDAGLRLSRWPTRTTCASLRWKEKYDQIPEDTQRPRAAQGEEGAEEEEAASPRQRAVLERGPVPEAAGRAARQALQPRAAALAAVGLHARCLAGDRHHPPAGRQAADGRHAPGSGPARSGADAAGAAQGRVRAAGSRTPDGGERSRGAGSGEQGAGRAVWTSRNSTF